MPPVVDEEKDPFLDVIAAGEESIEKLKNNNIKQRIAKSLLSLLLVITLVLIFAFTKDTEEIGQCPGNLVLLDCPCPKTCANVNTPQACSVEDCRPGCGCPSDLSFLIDASTCGMECPPTTEDNDNDIKSTVQRDFTDCPAGKLDQVITTSASPLLFQQKDTEIFHLRLSPADACEQTANISDVLLHFTLLARGMDCKVPPKEHVVAYRVSDNTKLIAPTGTIACLNLNTEEFDETIRGAWFFYIARLTGIPEVDTLVDYEIGMRKKGKGPAAILRKFVPPLRSGSKPSSSSSTDRPILVLGDTATIGAKIVTPSAAKIDTGYSLTLHVGDASYATNKGDCYEDKGNNSTNRCGFRCVGVHCHGADHVQSSEMLELYTWAKIVDANLGGKMIWASTMGNHDNDMPWFLTYRPPVIGAVPGVAQKYLAWKLQDESFLKPTIPNAEKQSLAMEYMRNPHFYSFDHGLMHVISISTEDNPVNAYETWNGLPISDERKLRFEEHYGKSSPQYQWLKNDLERASKRRLLVPWILIYTHRPMYHTAQHHAWCSKGGDWYACLFVETYEPLLKQYGVNFFLTGHSHHYQRSLPMYKEEVLKVGGTIHLIVGVGGYEVVGEKWVRNPDWMASRQGTTLGYARFWIKNETSIYWEHVSAENDTVLDSAWFGNTFL